MGLSSLRERGEPRVNKYPKFSILSGVGLTWQRLACRVELTLARPFLAGRGRGAFRRPSGVVSRNYMT